jgi:hypothetical protein
VKGKHAMDSDEIGVLLRSINERLGQIVAMMVDHAPEINPNRVYRRKDAARLLGVNVWTLDRARRKGLLETALPFGERDVRITGESMLRFQYGKRRSKSTVEVRRL